MGKLFIKLAVNITAISVNLDQILLEINADNTTFTNTIDIKKKLDKTEQSLNKIMNAVQQNTFSASEQDKLQQPLDKELERLKIIKNKLKELQKTINPYNYNKERNKLCRLLKKFNNKLEKLEFSNSDAFFENFNDPNKNKELLLQLKIFKNHVKHPTNLVNIANVTNETENNIRQSEELPNSQNKLLLS